VQENCFRGFSWCKSLALTTFPVKIFLVVLVTTTGWQHWKLKIAQVTLVLIIAILVSPMTRITLILFYYLYLEIVASSPSFGCLPSQLFRRGLSETSDTFILVRGGPTGFTSPKKSNCCHSQTAIAMNIFSILQHTVQRVLLTRSLINCQLKTKAHCVLCTRGLPGGIAVCPVSKQAASSQIVLLIMPNVLLPEFAAAADWLLFFSVWWVITPLYGLPM